MRQIHLAWYLVPDTWYHFCKLIFAQNKYKISSNSKSNTKKLSLNDIHIRTDLQVGDLPFVIQSHSDLYQREYNYGKTFDYYVIKGVSEFFEAYTLEKSRVWVCEHKGKRIGFLSLMERGAAAQLRFFFMNENYRGIGLVVAAVNK